MRYDDDAGLVKAVLDGDKDAFVFLVDRYQGAVYAYCLNQVRSEEDAKDVTQEVLLKAYLKLAQLKTPHAFRSWLYTIASNECRMWHRKRQSCEVLEAEVEATTAHPDDLETQLTVKKEIDALPESQRLVVLMHYFSGFSLKEIGEFLGTLRTAIKARLFRARQRLGLRLKGTFEEYFDSSTKPNFCVAILDRISSLPQPFGADSPVSKAHRLAPLPVAAVMSVIFLGGLAGLFPSGTDSGAPKGGMSVSLIDADSGIETAQRDGRKKRINVPVKPAKTDEQTGVSDKTSTSAAQVIGGGRVDDIVVSPDGQLIAVRTPFGLELRRPDSNRLSTTIDTIGRIHSLAFSRDGRFLIWSGDDQLTVWDIEKQETAAVHSFDAPRRNQIKRFSGWLRMAVHPEMKEIAVVLPWHEQDFDEIMFIDPISGNLLRSVKRSYTQDDLKKRNSFNDAMQYSPDGKQLVILDKGTKYVEKTHRFFFLNPRDGEILNKFEVPATAPELTFAYSPNGQWFAFLRWAEQQIDAINTRDWQRKKTFKFTGGAIWQAPVTFSSDGRYLAYGSDVWDFQTGKTVHTNNVGRFSQFLDNTHLLTSDLASIEMWEIKQDELLQKAVIRPGTPFWNAYFLPEDDTILAIGESLSLSRMGTTGELFTRDNSLEDFYPRIVAISPVDSHVAVPSTVKKKREIRIWDAMKFEVIHRIPFPYKKPRVLAFSPDGKQLAIGDASHTTRLWNIATGKEARRFVNRDNIIDWLNSAFVRALAFSSDGKQLACGGTFDAIWLWDVETGKLSQKLVLPTDLPPLDSSGQPIENLKRLRPGTPQDGTYSVMFLKFNISGKRLFEALSSGHFVVFDLVSGMVVKTLVPGFMEKAPNFVYPISVALNPDTSLMAVGRTDYVIELIETLRWQSVAELKGHRGHIGSLDFSHDGTKLLSKSDDGTMRVWKVERGWLGKAWLKIEKPR